MIEIEPLVLGVGVAVPVPAPDRVESAPCASGAPPAAQRPPPVRTERRGQASHYVPYSPTIAAPSTPVKAPPRGPWNSPGGYSAQSPIRSSSQPTHPPPRPSQSAPVIEAQDVNPWERMTAEVGPSGAKGSYGRRSPYTDTRPRPAEDRKGGKGLANTPWRQYPDWRERHPSWVSRHWREDRPSSSTEPHREWTAAEWDAYIESFQ